MLLSTQTKLLGRKLGQEQAIKMIAQAGFDAYDFSMGRIQYALDETSAFGVGDEFYHFDDYAEKIMHLKEIADSLGIVCNQAHGPFPSQKYADQKYSEITFEMIIRSMECASLLGAKQIVMHPVKDCPLEVDAFEYNIAFFERLIPYCRKYDIKIAIENMFIEDKKRGHIISSVCGMSKEHATMCDRLGREHFTACLDLGHSGLAGNEAYIAIHDLGKERLKALHVHDNDYRTDVHTYPYLGKMDWNKTLKALADIGYEGDFTFEIDNCLTRLPVEVVPEALKFLCVLGRNMIKQIEEFEGDRNRS